MFSYIKISDLRDTFMEKDISRLNISMNDVYVIEFTKTLKYIIGHFPNLLLRNSCFGSDSFLYTSLTRK